MTLTESRTRPRAGTVALWVLDLFADVGAGQWLRYVVGVLGWPAQSVCWSCGWPVSPRWGWPP